MKQLTPPLSVVDTNNVSFSQVTKHTKRPLCILVSVLMSQVALAETTAVVESGESQDYVPSTQVDTIVVTAAPDAANEATKEVVTSKNIQDNQINSQQDLVRYNPEISVAEAGRYGSKGFAIRGVDGNRVAMSYDGVGIPEQQINEFFSPYGYMYEGRFSPDTELLSDVSLQVGADSFTSGSGAIGGAVNYKSKEPRDLIESGKQIGGYAKTGYTSKNEEMMAAVGLAGSTEKVEALVNYVYREGHELKNHDMVAFNKDKLDPAYDFGHDPDYSYDIGKQDSPDSHASVLPDPLHYESHAVLAKAYYHPTDEHRIGVQGAYQYRLNNANNFSRKTSSYSGERISYDETELTGYGVNYRYLPLDSTLIDEINADASYQQTVGIANTYIYDKPKVAGDKFKFSNTEYRPLYDTTKQVNISGYLLPIETAFGTHSVSVLASYANIDHELIMQKVYPTETNLDFVGPSVKKNVYNIAIADNIEINDQFDAKLGIRYDVHDYQPYMSDIDKAGLGKIRPVETHYPRILYKNGVLTKDRKIDNLGGMLSLNYKLTPNWQTGYKLSTGFLAPTISQMYSAYAIFGNNLRPNPQLEPERSLNHELSLRGDFNTFSVSATGFYTDYTDFISSHSYDVEERNCWAIKDNTELFCPLPPEPQTKFVNYVGARNIDKAKTYGVTVGGLWDISEIAHTDGNIQLTGAVSYAKDSTDEGSNLLVTQPLTGVFGLNYVSPNEDYQIHANMRYLGAKKPEDAKVVFIKYGGYDDQAKKFRKNQYSIEPYKFIDRSETAFVYDLYGSKSFDNGLKVSAGIYNIFDKKYIPWDSLRTLATVSVNSIVDEEGRGLARYTAPGRNYAVALTYEF